MIVITVIAVSILATAVLFYLLTNGGKIFVKKNLSIKVFIALILLGLVLAFLIRYVNQIGIPTSFKKGIDTVINNQDVNAKIGRYESYSYDIKELPKESDNPAIFKIIVNGDSASLFLTCTMKKDSLGHWALIKIKQDSIQKR